MKPRKGQKLYYRDEYCGIVRSTEGNLCWYDTDHDTVDLFIWRFRDGLNRLFSWDGKGSWAFDMFLHGIALEAAFSRDYDAGNWRSCHRDGWYEQRGYLFVQEQSK